MGVEGPLPADLFRLTLSDFPSRVATRDLGLKPSNSGPFSSTPTRPDSTVSLFFSLVGRRRALVPSQVVVSSRFSGQQTLGFSPVVLSLSDLGGSYPEKDCRGKLSVSSLTTFGLSGCLSESFVVGPPPE